MQVVNIIATMYIGDTCVIYHIGDERKVAVVAEVVCLPYSDPSANQTMFKVVDVVPVQAIMNGATFIYQRLYINVNP